MAQSDLVQSLLRGMELLRLAASAPEGMRLSELAEKSGLQKTSPRQWSYISAYRYRNFQWRKAFSDQYFYSYLQPGR